MNVGDTALLKEIATTRRAKLDSDRTRGIVEITADKYTCVEVAGDIHRLVRQIQTIEFDLRPFTSLTQNTHDRSSHPDILPLVAERCRCAVKQSKTRDIVRLTVPNFFCLC